MDFCYHDSKLISFTALTLMGSQGHSCPHNLIYQLDTYAPVTMQTITLTLNF